jgi:hypothetical protein
MRYYPNTERTPAVQTTIVHWNGGIRVVVERVEPNGERVQVADVDVPNA